MFTNEFIYSNINVNQLDINNYKWIFFMRDDKK